MPLIINGTAADRSTIEQWLKQICWSVTVDTNTGVVGMVAGLPPPGAHQAGCACLDQLIRGHRTVTIEPVSGPDFLIPGPVQFTVAEGGGSAIMTGSGAALQPNASPGRGPDGNVGSDCLIYIDMSNNYDAGYSDNVPMWLVLAHELTGGHAFHMTQGTDGPTDADAERQAIESENEHREEHGMDLRPLPEVGNGEADENRESG